MFEAITPELTDELRERLSAEVKVGAPDECWPCKGRSKGKGYGQLRVGGRAIGMHRLALMFAKGLPPAPGLMALHSCDNPPCCNPAHLSWGTGRRNSLECVERGNHPLSQRTHCPQGHPYDDRNTVWRRGWRECRKCKSAGTVRSAQKKRRERAESAA